MAGHPPVAVAALGASVVAHRDNRIDLTRRLGAATIAEGVETAAELAELRQIGCAMAQGYHFSPAVPPAELEALLGFTDARDVPATRPVPTTLPAG